MQVVNKPITPEEDTQDFIEEPEEEAEEIEEVEDSNSESDQEDIEDAAEDVQDDTTEEDPESIDFFQLGPYEVVQESQFASVTDCSSMDYGVYYPEGISNPPVVVLGHGFARGSSVMTGWAEHLSSWGVEVLLPTLCHYNVFTGVDHEMNGQNMKELASLRGAVDVIYAGHSAGGLAAIIAASQDDNAIGVLGLDTTDTQDVPGVADFIGREYAGGVTSPAFSLRGESSSCNSSNNGLDLFRMMGDYKAVKINSADHCDFENPTDFICELNCESESSEFSDEDISPVIINLSTAAIMSITGISEYATTVWTPEGLQEWIDFGIVQDFEQ